MPWIAEIRSSMETVVVAHDVSGRPLHLDVHAAVADRLLARQPDQAAHRVPRADRERLHEDVGGRVRQAAGAAQFHSSGALVMRDQLLEGVDRAARDRPGARRRGLDRGPVR